MTPAFADGFNDCRKRVVEQNHRGSLARNVRAAFAHGDADVGLAQRRRVVDAVSGHGHHFAFRLVGPHEVELLRGIGAREDVRSQGSRDVIPIPTALAMLRAVTA